MVNAIFYIAQSGDHLRMPQRIYFYDDGTWLSINQALVIQSREEEGREASPTAGVIDRQSKTTQSAGPHGYDAG